MNPNLCKEPRNRPVNIGDVVYCSAAASGLLRLNSLTGCNCWWFGGSWGCWSRSHTMFRLSTIKRQDIRKSYRSLICFAIVKKACSTFVAFFADVSRKGMVNWSANSCIQKEYQDGIIRIQTTIDVPLPHCTRQLSFPLNLTYCQRAACWHPPMHTGQSLATIVSHL